MINMKTYYYIYCITSAIPDDSLVNIKGIEDEKIIVIHFKDICALVSPTHLTRHEPTFENLKCHEQVANIAMKFCTVLPLSFSSIIQNEDNVCRVLEKYYQQLKENLENVNGKVELGIKIFYKLDYEVQDKLDKKDVVTPKMYMEKRFERYLERKKQMEEITHVLDAIHDNLVQEACSSHFSKPFNNNFNFKLS